ncbi:MAG TPA: ABC transporter permease [Acidimicrobiales bacterium]|nr:ABC transporter permease [Acidimicrobiales bacterium]
MSGGDGAGRGAGAAGTGASSAGAAGVATVGPRAAGPGAPGRGAPGRGGAGAASPSGGHELARRVRESIELSSFAVIGVIVVLFVVLSATSSNFLTGSNLSNVLDETAEYGIMAAGEALVFISGGFDLSIGAIYALAGIFCAMAAQHMPTPLALILGTLSGLGMGIVNGLLVTLARINAFIATIGTQFVISSVALVVTGGLLISDSSASFVAIGRGSFLGVTYYSYAWLAVVVVTGFVLWRTRLGRYMKAAGGGEAAARLAGIRVGLVRTTAFALSGACAALAGVIEVSRTGTGNSNVDPTIPLTVIAAVVIGGVSIFGGEGAIWRTVIGALILTLIDDGLALLNVAPTWEQAFEGVIILIAVGFDAWTRLRR